DTENPDDTENPGDAENPGDTENPGNTGNEDDARNPDGTSDKVQTPEEQNGNDQSSQMQTAAKTGDTAQPYVFLGIMGAALVVTAIAVRKIKA
ncbi:MAG TPA: hypothetical protein IAA08_09185, partial [Candidatus Eubacterium avistercoris]|nr:hypothetical protein [Candidatus Eubacterium avistercoris]